MDPPLTLGQFAVFAAAAGAMILSPGPDTVYVLGRGLAERRLGVAAAAGTTTGILAHTLAVVAGLAVLVRASPVAFQGLRAAGAAYLALLGVRTIRNRRAEVGAREAGDDSPVGAYAGGLAVNLLNPQVLVFFLAFLPQFVDPGRSEPLQLGALGGVYAALTMAYLGTVAALSAAVRRSLLDAPRRVAGVRALTGLALLGFGLRLAAQPVA